MALGSSRRQRGGGGLDAWPGYVDALSTLLMVIIFVLLVFVLAQGFLSVALSSRDRALDRLNRQVAELADLLALERDQASELRGALGRSAEELRAAAALRDALSAQLRDAREQSERLGAERDGALAERDRLAARLTDLDLAGRGAAERIATLQAQLDAALQRVEGIGTDAAQTARRLTETGRSLAAERTAREQAEARAAALDRALAAERSARQQAEARGTDLDRALAAERSARQQAEARGTELDRALAAERSARQQAEARGTDLDRALAAERSARQQAEARGTELDRALAAERSARQQAEARGTELDRALAAERSARQQAEARGTELDRALAAERSARQQAEARGTELDRALAAERSARQQAEARGTDLDRALAAERSARQRAETRIAELDRQVADARGAAETVRRELATLTRQVQEAQAQLADTQRQLAAMRAERTALDAQVRADRATIEARLADLARLSEQVRALTALRDQLERQAQEASRRAEEEAARRRLAEAATGTEAERRAAAERAGAEQARLAESARAQVALFGRQLEDLRREIARLTGALDAAEAVSRDKEGQLAVLGARLNAALAARVEELQRYRSDFFGRLRDVLGDRPEVRIVGDRFVFQSEVLFPTGSAELSAAGREQIRTIARVLQDIAQRIPPDTPWLLRVDGHADRTPVRASIRFATNWELSAARAISVAQLLMAEGLPPNRVAATAFGENQPIDPADTAEAYARNRRIELRLTDR